MSALALVATGYADWRLSSSSAIVRGKRYIYAPVLP